MSKKIKHDKYFDLEVEVEESTVVIYQGNDEGLVIDKNAAKRLIEILKDFVE